MTDTTNRTPARTAKTLTLTLDTAKLHEMPMAQLLALYELFSWASDGMYAQGNDPRVNGQGIKNAAGDLIEEAAAHLGECAVAIADAAKQIQPVTPAEVGMKYDLVLQDALRDGAALELIANMATQGVIDVLGNQLADWKKDAA